MNLSFDLDSIRFIEFGVGRDHVGNQTFDAVPTVGCQRNWTLLRPRKPKRLGVVEAPSEG